MPSFPPPWPEDDERLMPRDEYRSGLWAYAVGRAACDHPRYGEACAVAESAGWSPWWIRSVADVEATMAGCWFDEQAGDRTCRFLEKLKLSKGEWRGELLRLFDCQRYDLVMPLYGWMSPDGARRFTRGGIWVPKKFGKSCICSGLGLYHLRADREGAPYVWVAATTRGQAGQVHDESARMVKRTAGLASDLECIDYIKRILFKREDGKFEALSAEADVQEGLDWSAGIFDEIHVASRKMWSTLAGGGAARRQPLMLSISTAGIYDSLSLGWEQWDLGMKVRAGDVINHSYFSLMYYAEQGNDPFDDTVIRRANPGLGITCKQRFLSERRLEAQQTPAKLADWQRYHLNVWVNAAERAIPTRVWAQCGTRRDLWEELKGRRCWCGLDLSLNQDITALALWFPPLEPTGKHAVLPWFWLPADNVLRLERETGNPYKRWAAAELMELTPGTVVDYQAVRERVKALGDDYNIQEVDMDPWNASRIQQDLETDGFLVVEVRQGMKTMAPATKEFERLLLGGELEHPNHEILTWMASNCQYDRDRRGNFMYSKGDGRVRLKIDGIQAAVTAWSRAMATAAAAEEASVYEERGIQSL
jgi:phage terminase large subunit-like protein